MKIVFNQAESWGRHPYCFDCYSQTDCCFCGKPVKPGFSQLRLSRTSDGEWWLVSEDFQPSEDDFGDRIFYLPVGPNCLRKHPEWKFAVVK